MLPRSKVLTKLLKMFLEVGRLVDAVFFKWVIIDSKLEVGELDRDFLFKLVYLVLRDLVMSFINSPTSDALLLVGGGEGSDGRLFAVRVSSGWGLPLSFAFSRTIALKTELFLGDALGGLFIEVLELVDGIMDCWLGWGDLVLVG